MLEEWPTLNCGIAVITQGMITLARKVVRSYNARPETFWVEQQYNCLHTILTYYELTNLGFDNAMNLGYDEKYNVDKEYTQFQIPQDTDFGSRFCLQLYRRVVAPALERKVGEGATILEISCGRGGGTAFVAEIATGSTVVGMDLSTTGIAHCKEKYKSRTELTFQQGNALALDFEDESFDIVLNVESSHCYADHVVFFSEVKRVLVRGGCFCYCDIMPPTSFEQLKALVHHLGMQVNIEEDITDAVLSALATQGKRRKEAIAQLPMVVRANIANVIGAEGSTTFNNFKEGKWHYYRLFVHKPI